MKRWYFFFGLVALLGGLGSWWHCNVQPSSDTDNKMEVIHPEPKVVKNTSTTLHEKSYQLTPPPIFLTSKASRFSATFVVQNNLFNDVSLTAKRSSCGCLGITLEPEILGPLEYSTVTLSAELGTKSVSKKLSADIVDASTGQLVASCGVKVDAYSVFEVSTSTPRVIQVNEYGNGETAIALLHHRVSATPVRLPTVMVADNRCRIKLLKHEEIQLPRSVVCHRFTYSVSVIGLDVSSQSQPLAILRLLAKFQDQALNIPITLKANPSVCVSPQRIMLSKSKDLIVRRVVLTSRQPFQITAVRNSKRISLTYPQGVANRVHVLTIAAGHEDINNDSVEPETETVVISVDHPGIREVTFVVYH